MNEKITEEQKEILYSCGTEIPGTSELLNEKRSGIYITADKELPVFRSDHKFESGTGWPSFWEPASEESVETQEDLTLGMKRIEVHCQNCQAHLGHVFPDGPQPTGLRYCINSVSLDLEPKNLEED